MTGSSAPRVTVKLLPSASFTDVVFSAHKSGGAQPLTVTVSGNDRLEKALEQLDDGLLRLKEELPSLTASDQDLARAYLALRKLGIRLLNTLFGHNEDMLQGIREFWQSVMPFARNPQYPLQVDCISPAATIFPLEYLPLLGLPERTARSDRAELLDQFRSFLGFSCIIRRQLLMPVPGAPIELTPISGDRLPVRYLQYESLPGARQELDWLSTHASGRVKLEGPFPAAKSEVSLADQIYDPRLLVAGGSRATPDQIQHFSCHCYTKARTPLDSEIELSGEGRDVRLRLGELSDDFTDMAMSSERRAFDLPLVFLNACGSARMQADGAFSFPQLFLQNKNRGFIGTEIEMPDDVASAFSSAFYERFLLWRIPLGRSMLEARRHLLYSLGNPLGIAYTFYGDPELHVGSAQAGGDS